MELNGRKDDLGFANNGNVREDSVGRFNDSMLNGEEWQNDGFNVYGDNDPSKDPDYEEFLKYETNRVNREAEVDKLIWHHIYAIMNAVGAGTTLTSSISAFFGSFARETAGETMIAILTVLFVAAYNGFILYACIQVLEKKAIGVKYIRIKTIIDMVLNGLGMGLSILLICIGGFADDFFGVVFSIIGIAMALSFGIGFTIALITNIYYQKREHMFQK